MKPGIKAVFKSFSVEFLIYSVLVVSYFLLVLHFLGPWLNHLFQQERKTYAAMAVLLIIAQGILLEQLTRLLVRVIGINKQH